MTGEMSVGDVAGFFDIVEREHLAGEMDLMMYCSMASMVSPNMPPGIRGRNRCGACPGVLHQWVSL